MASGTALEHFIAEEIGAPVEGIESLIGKIQSIYGDSVAAILFYGSCLRTGDFRDKVLDFYVIVDSYRAAYNRLWLAAANRSLPPNVFYTEADGEEFRLRVKYAVLSTDHFDVLASPKTFNSSVWVRFAQPCRLVYARDEAARNRMVRAVASSVVTAVRSVVGLIGEPVTAERVWCELFRESYRVELRAEGGGRPRDIFDAGRERYEAVTPLALAQLGLKADEQGRIVSGAGRVPGARTQRIAWTSRMVQGKALSVLRLLKAAFTFDGGIDYLAWKIRRHSGVEISITPWQRRHPVLAGLVLFVQLRLKGAFR